MIKNKKNKRNAGRVIYFLLAFFCLSLNAQQNLVPNGSFEDTVQCPTTIGQINYSKYWVDPTAGTLSSPDYFNACSQWAGIPQNGFGFQLPKTGVAYAGLYNFQVAMPGGYRFCEYIQSQLLDSLSNNKNYCVKFYVSYSKKFDLNCSDLGLYFSKTQISRSDSTVFHYQPQIKNLTTNFITDTINWILIQGLFNSTGGEKFITIGNFDLQDDTIRTDYGPYSGSYFYIDDVSVVEVSPAFAGNDTSYCTSDTAKIGSAPTFEANYIWTKESGNAFMDSNNIAQPKVWANSSGTTTFIVQKTQCSVITYDTVNVTFACVDIDEMNFENLFSVYPNPVNDEIIIQAKKLHENFSIQLFDASGREIKKVSSQKSNSLTVNTTEFGNGIYLLKFNFQNGKILSKRIIVNH